MAGKLWSGKTSSSLVFLVPVLHLLVFFLLLFKIRVAEASPDNNNATAVILSGSSTILSPNRTFELGFSTDLDNDSSSSSSYHYLAIWYASLPIRTFAWIANRKLNQTTNLTDLTLLILAGQLSIVDSATGSAIWTTGNQLPATHLRLLDTGNLLLLTPTGQIAWQSFDFPTDTWLPEMPITVDKSLLSWKSPSDPSPGLYSLRLQPHNFGEFELVFNASLRYWSTGNWTGTRFTGVPEMTVPYIYTFLFSDPFTPAASFVYSQTPPPPGPDDAAAAADGPVLSRFVVDSSGRLVQYVWSSQAATWNAFWSRPESGCSVYGRCGNLGFCVDGIRQCRCVGGLVPADLDAWGSGDFSGGCASPCGSGDRFEDIGGVNFDGAVSLSIAGVGRSTCEDSCRSNCSCFGIGYDSETKLCRYYYGNVYNLRNSTGGSPVLYLRRMAASDDSSKRIKKKPTKLAPLIGSICALLLIVGVASVISIVFWRRGRKEMDKEVQGANCNLRVFSYKELSAATHSFSEKLGQGGFGTVFRGELSDSTPVAVKRLERPGSGGGEREFRAEVRTIGAVHHVNLVRLRGFCCEDPHRLLVYEYMPGGPLSAYLDRARPSELSWQARFRIALGTARGIAYLHEECRDRIIHCDIKPDNILLDNGHVPKVADFGLAKLMGRDFSRVLATMRGTWGYVAPEWISGIAITTKADVYSYGMTLLEILGGRRNVEAVAEAETTEEGWYFPPWAARRIIEGDVAAVVDTALAGEYDMGELERAAKVAVWCIQDEEAARPTMGTVLKMLEGTVEVAVPPLPKLLQALVSGESFPRAGIVSVSGEEISADPDQSLS